MTTFLVQDDISSLPPECVSEEESCSIWAREGIFDLMESAMSDLPPTWEMLFLGYCDEDCARLRLLGPHLGEGGKEYCYHAYAISERGVDKMLYKMKLVKHFAPIDWAHRAFNHFTPGYNWTINFLSVVAAAEKGEDFFPYFSQPATLRPMYKNESMTEFKLRRFRERKILERSMLRSLQYVHEEGLEAMVSEDYSPDMTIESYVIVPAVLHQSVEVGSTLGRSQKKYPCRAYLY